MNEMYWLWDVVGFPEEIIKTATFILKPYYFEEQEVVFLKNRKLEKLAIFFGKPHLLIGVSQQHAVSLKGTCMLPID